MISRTSRLPPTSVRGPVALMLAGVVMMGAATTFASVPASAAGAAGATGITGGAVALADLEPRGDPDIASADDAAHHDITVRLSTLAHRTGDVVTSVLLQGPDPETGRPGWSRCIDLPQSAVPTWNELPVQLAYPAEYTASSYKDSACADGFNYHWSTGTISTRFTHWSVYTFRAPRISLR